ncbi:MAG TPA: hypothetical protein DDW42_00785 [Desulfobacteraceae bacterium]|nr:hypothetical protein [Desulfobacteraceae bacterium]
MLVKRLMSLLLFAALMWAPAGPVMAGPRVSIVVKTILASQGSKFIDPNLSAVIKELQSVFRYSSYRLLNQNSMNLGMGEKGTVLLPGNRVLRIMLLGIAGKRVQLRLAIFKKKKKIFQTVTQLLNKNSIIVGGPRHRGGYLLFNIFTSF